MSIICNCDPWYITMIQEIPSVVIVGILGVGGIIAYKFKDRIINFYTNRILNRNTVQTTNV